MIARAEDDARRPVGRSRVVMRMVSTLCKLSGVLAASFVLLETLLLVANDLVFHDSFYMYDPDLGFRVRPYAHYGRQGQWTANEFGFNDRDYAHEPAREAFRILVLGDSFNWTFGHEGNYVGLLEARLHERFGEDRVDVINAGYSSTQTAEQLALLEKFGLRYQPDLVVLMLYAGNDFLEADPGRRRIAYGGTTIDIWPERDFHWTLFGQPVLARSRLLLFLRERWVAWTRMTPSIQAQLDSPPASPGRPARPWPDRTQRTYSDAYLKHVQGKLMAVDKRRRTRFDPHEELVHRSLLGMRDLLAERGIDFVVVVHPDQFQIDPHLRDALIARRGLKRHLYDWNRPQRQLADWCEDGGIECHDWQPPFQRAFYRNRPIFLPNDSHWDIEGNHLAAELLEQMLAERVAAALTVRRE
jgi:hypothetical protein